MNYCTRCGTALTPAMTHCPTCGLPKPPPLAQGVSPVDQEVEREVKNVSCLGGAVTAAMVAFALLIIGIGVIYTVIAGCCGSFTPHGVGNRPLPKVNNPMVVWLGPIVAGLVVMWVILAIVIFVIRRRKR